MYMRFIGLFGGSLAGVFGLALFTKRASGVGALIGAVAGASMLFYVQRYTNICFMLYSSIGICTSFIVGYAASFIFPASPKKEAA
jgi:hypothetical protein